MNKFFKIIKSTYMCIKYPFLYPRNRWTGRHYNNWKIINKIKELYNLAYDAGGRETGFKPILKDRKYAVMYRILKFYHDHVLQWFHCLTSYTEWDAIEPGWKKAFGKQLLKELNAAMLEDGGKEYVRSVRIMQIKEKWGTLQIYLSTYGNKTLEVISKYERISWHTCIDCGRPAVGYTTGWISPYCHMCYYDMKKKYDDKKKWFKFFNEPDEDNLLELENDEYNYGHNVEIKQYSEDGD